MKATKIDMLSLSAHKFHGPKGIGALYVRKGVRFHSLIWGGKQERGRRAGTENAPCAVGMGKAASLALARLPESARLAALRDSFEASVPSLTNDSQLTANHSACGNEEGHLHIFGPGEPGLS
jgi:cysteine desulfurase